MVEIEIEGLVCLEAELSQIRNERQRKATKTL